MSVFEMSLCPSPSTPTSLSAMTPVTSSQPFRLLKVILAFRMWYRGISAQREDNYCIIVFVSLHKNFSVFLFIFSHCFHLFLVILVSIYSLFILLSPPLVNQSFIPILTGKPGGKCRVMKLRSLANKALEIAMRSMIGATCSARERGWDSHNHSLALNLGTHKDINKYLESINSFYNSDLNFT